MGSRFQTDTLPENGLEPAFRIAQLDRSMAERPLVETNLCVRPLLDDNRRFVKLSLA